ncbi:hypothetical protein F4677DRAFT_407141 [Hypoxylon crocopeplum]|nr:hypothetical protein F4677DRAFT_407141 [Hypoxylon crocopeplum]
MSKSVAMVEPKEPKELKSGRTDVPEHITARRERGKLAQRAFRQRQIDTIRSLEDENQKLRDAISTITDAAGRSDAALSLAILEARKVAGLPVAEVKGQLPAPIVTNSDDSGWSSSGSNDDAANVAATSSLDDDMFEFLIPSFDAKETADSWSRSFLAGNSQMYNTSSGLQRLDGGIGTTTANLLPAAGYANPTEISPFEPDRAFHLATPPPDIMPYMGAGAYTLAGQMYWTAMAFGFQAIRALTTSSTPPPAAVETVSDLFTHTLKRAALPQIMTLMHARLAFRNPKLDLESLRAERWALDPALTAELGAAMAAELQAAGIRKDDFLTPLDVERTLRDRFRDEYPVFEAALRGQALAADHVACMRRLMQIMSRQSICFGDGPRWRPESVDTLVNGWKMNTKSVVAAY